MSTSTEVEDDELLFAEATWPWIADDAAEFPTPDLFPAEELPPLDASPISFWRLSGGSSEYTVSLSKSDK